MLVKEEGHEQDVPCCALRNALRTVRADGHVLSEGVRLADTDARRADGPLCARHDDRNRGQEAEDAGRDQWRLLPETPGLASTVSFGRHCGRRYRRRNETGKAGGRRSTRRADADTG